MNPFNHGISFSEVEAADIENLALRITAGQETSLPSVSWFNAYKTSEFPEVICDKAYFFLYGTDHDLGDGGIKWGKGNNLNLTDFIEVGLIVSGYQAETPYLVRVPSAELPDNEVLHLFYHTQNTEPGNNNIQQTRLITSAGGNQLHLNTWTDKGRPLGALTGETHTGYLIPYKRGVNDWIGTHITKAGLPQPWYYSTSTDCRAWTRGTQIDTVSGVQNNYFAQLSEGLYFDYLGQQWWMGQIHPDSGTITGDDRMLIIAKSGTRFGKPVQQVILNNEIKNIRHSIHIDGDTAHVYITNPVSKLYHATYDLTNLQNHL